MKAYVVRLVEEPHELVGFYFVGHPRDLFDYVDEIVSPYDCEYAAMPEGGVGFPNKNSIALPIDIPDGENEPEDTSWTASVTENWFDVLCDELAWTPVRDDATVFAGMRA